MNKYLKPFFSAILISVFSVVAFANDKEEKKEEAGAEKAKAAPPATLPPWIAIEAKIQELSSKIKSKEESLQKLLEEKNHMPENSPHVKETLKLILKEHAELKNLADDYKKNISMLNYRYPERNAKTGRSYDRIEVKSINEMEQAMGVDGKLNRNIKKMRTQYGTGSEKDNHPDSHAKPASKAKNKQSPSIDEEGAIIINK